MGNCLSGRYTHAAEAGDDVRGRGGQTRKYARGERNQSTILFEYHEGTCALEYYEPVRSVGEGSISSIHLVRRRKQRVDIPYKERADIMVHANTMNGNKNSSDTSSDTSEGSEQLYILKSIIKDHVQDDLYLDELRSEIHNMKYLDHPHIAKVYEAYERKRHVYLIMEYLSGGDLRKRMPYTEAEAADIIKDILSAVRYLHKRGVVHRDLKLENVVFENDTPNAKAKVIDFGLSTKYLSDEYKHMRERVGTVYTMAPQVIQGKYTSACDLWSVGVIAYMLLSGGQMPFPGKSRQQVINKIMRCDYSFRGKNWEMVSKEAKDFISSLLKMDPKERPTAKEALKSKWMRKEFPTSAPKLQNSDLEDACIGLHKYSKETKLKRLALLLIAHKSSTNDIVKMRELFEKYDQNGDGVITYREFRNILSSVGNRLSQEEVRQLFKGIDFDNNGLIDYSEFLAATLETRGRIETQRLREAFDRLDCDHSGLVTKDDIKEVLLRDGKKGKKNTDLAVDSIFEELDTEHAGAITFEEFVDLFEQRKKEELRDLCCSMSRRCIANYEDADNLEDAIIPGGKHTLTSAHTTPSTYIYDDETKSMRKVGDPISIARGSY